MKAMVNQTFSDLWAGFHQTPCGDSYASRVHVELRLREGWLSAGS